MSVQVYVKDKVLISFENENDATLWIEKHPEMYEGNLKNVQVFSTEPLENLLIASEEVKVEFPCLGCGLGLRIWRHPAETHLNVICPNCHTNHGIEAPDVSTPKKSGDES